MTKTKCHLLIVFLSVALLGGCASINTDPSKLKRQTYPILHTTTLSTLLFHTPDPDGSGALAGGLLAFAVGAAIANARETNFREDATALQAAMETLDLNELLNESLSTHSIPRLADPLVTTAVAPEDSTEHAAHVTLIVGLNRDLGSGDVQLALQLDGDTDTPYYRSYHYALKTPPGTRSRQVGRCESETGSDCREENYATVEDNLDYWGQDGERFIEQVRAGIPLITHLMRRDLAGELQPIDPRQRVYQWLHGFRIRTELIEDNGDHWITESTFGARVPSVHYVPEAAMTEQ